MTVFGIPLPTLGFALIGGVVPTFFWLWFWLREDGEKPEPKGLIFLTFIAGMLGVLIVLPIENWLYHRFYNNMAVIISTAFAEELVKYFLVALVAFKTRFFDETLDPAIYMITGALGFAALENTLFLIEPIISKDFAITFFTGNLRFLGATVLHVVCSAVVGIAVGLAFYKKPAAKRAHLLFGLLTAGVLHALFNFFIMKSTTENVITVFGIVWVVAVIIMLLFEKLKRMEPHEQQLRTHLYTK